MTRRETPQAQINLKWRIGVLRKPKRSKNTASGNSASLNQLKMARREIPQAQINLKWRVGVFRKPKKSKRWSSGNSDAVFFHNEKCCRRPKSRTFVGN